MNPVDKILGKDLSKNRKIKKSTDIIKCNVCQRKSYRINMTSYEKPYLCEDCAVKKYEGAM